VAAVDETDRRPPLNTDLDALRRVITDIVAPAATSTDELGVFPRPAVTALAEAGILGPVQ
jgi:hypothetical protein